MDPASRAVTLHTQGKFKSLRQAAAALNVPKTTALRRKSGIPPRSLTTNGHARLTEIQERVLVAWIIDAQTQYRPPNQTLIRQVALLLARQNEPSVNLSKYLVYRFLQRHPELRIKRNKLYEKSRILTTIPQ